MQRESSNMKKFERSKARTQQHLAENSTLSEAEETATDSAITSPPASAQLTRAVQRIGLLEEVMAKGTVCPPPARSEKFDFVQLRHLEKEGDVTIYGTSLDELSTEDLKELSYTIGQKRQWLQEVLHLDGNPWLQNSPDATTMKKEDLEQDLKVVTRLQNAIEKKILDQSVGDKGPLIQRIFVMEEFREALASEIHDETLKMHWYASQQGLRMDKASFLDLSELQPREIAGNIIDIHIHGISLDALSDQELVQLWLRLAHEQKALEAIEDIEALVRQKKLIARESLMTAIAKKVLNVHDSIQEQIKKGQVFFANKPLDDMSRQELRQLLVFISQRKKLIEVSYFQALRQSSIVQQTELYRIREVVIRKRKELNSLRRAIDKRHQMSAAKGLAPKDHPEKDSSVARVFPKGTTRATLAVSAALTALQMSTDQAPNLKEASENLEEDPQDTQKDPQDSGPSQSEHIPESSYGQETSDTVEDIHDTPIQEALSLDQQRHIYNLTIQEMEKVYNDFLILHETHSHSKMLQHLDSIGQFIEQQTPQLSDRFAQRMDMLKAAIQELRQHVLLTMPEDSLPDGNSTENVPVTAPQILENAEQTSQESNIVKQALGAIAITKGTGTGIGGPPTSEGTIAEGEISPPSEQPGQPGQQPGQPGQPGQQPISRQKVRELVGRIAVIQGARAAILADGGSKVAAATAGKGLMSFNNVLRGMILADSIQGGVDIYQKSLEVPAEIDESEPQDISAEQDISELQEFFNMFQSRATDIMNSENIEAIGLNQQEGTGVGLETVPPDVLDLNRIFSPSDVNTRGYGRVVTSSSQPLDDGSAADDNPFSQRLNQMAHQMLMESMGLEQTQRANFGLRGDEDLRTSQSFGQSGHIRRTPSPEEEKNLQQLEEYLQQGFGFDQPNDGQSSVATPNIPTAEDPNPQGSVALGREDLLVLINQYNERYGEESPNEDLNETLRKIRERIERRPESEEEYFERMERVRRIFKENESEVPASHPDTQDRERRTAELKQLILGKLIWVPQSIEFMELVVNAPKILKMAILLIKTLILLPLKIRNAYKRAHEKAREVKEQTPESAPINVSSSGVTNISPPVTAEATPEDTSAEDEQSIQSSADNAQSSADSTANTTSSATSATSVAP